MTDDEIIAVVQAHKDGKEIEAEPRGHGAWKETFPEGKPISWNFHLFDYRVKPEPRKPREFWIGQIIQQGSCATHKWDICEYPTVGFMHVREVIE